MAFVVSDGKLVGLDRAQAPRSSRVVLAGDYAEDYATIWRTQPQVRTVVGFLARNIADLGIHVFERISDTDRKRLADHPLAKLLGMPNRRTTRYRLVEATVADMAIYDVACWAKIRPAGSTAGLVRLLPKMLKPVGESWLWHDAIEVRGSKGAIELPAEQVVLFHGYSPIDNRWGVSPMETLRRILAEEYQAGIYREQLWRNGARFPGHITRPAGANWKEGARERFRADWHGLYTGLGPAAGGTPILEDGMDFKANGITPADAQYLETRKLTREEVAAAFHIPLPMVGILDHATFSNIQEQHKHLYQDCLGPWLTMMKEELALQLLPDFDSTGNVYIEFNLAEKLKGSFEEQSTSLQSAVGRPIMTANEGRARVNLPWIEGGDELVTPLNVLVGGQASPTDTAPPPDPDVPKAGRRRIKSAPPPTHIAKHVEVLERFFRRQGSVVKSRLGAAADEWWDGSRWDSELTSDLYRLAVQTSETVALDTLGKMGLDPDVYDVDRTLAYLLAVAKRRAENINGVTKRKLDEALAEDGVDPVVAAGAVFGVAEGARAAQAAQSAATSWAGFGTTEAGKQGAGDRAVKTWITGANPRPAHAAMDGETVAIDSPFSNGLDWPGAAGEPDETAGCNCSVSISI